MDGRGTGAGGLPLTAELFATETLESRETNALVVYLSVCPSASGGYLPSSGCKGELNGSQNKTQNHEAWKKTGRDGKYS